MSQYFHTSDIWVNIIIFYIFYYLRELLLSPFMITISVIYVSLGGSFWQKTFNLAYMNRKFMFSSTTITYTVKLWKVLLSLIKK